MRAPRRRRAVALGLALVAGALALLLSVWVFPYHSVNHDEGVYLQQAAMLLEGRLFLHPPVPEAFRPWFFVRDGTRLYPKYAPVPAAMFALGELAGSYRLALPAVAAAATGLTYGVVAEAFDRRRGLVAAALFVASPLLLVQSAVFLPYLPTATLDLLFAFAYLRADRTGSRRWAALAGAAIGLAFFSRPYTAVLFAAPFLVHALWTLRSRRRSALVRHGVTAALGLAGVSLALAYNAVVTGSPLVFPYAAFAPLDGLGFGRRELLGYAVDYTPALALRANAEVLWLFATRWFVAGPLGTALTGVGVVAFAARLRRPVTGDDARRLVLLGVAASVVLGNGYFWGNLNVLGDLAEPADGLVHLLGPYYHVDLLLPAVAFGAHGTLTLVGRGRAAVRARFEPGRARRVLLAGLVVAAAVLGAGALVAAAGPIQDDRATTDRLARAYAPFEERDLEDSLVFLPTPYGDWLNHPFQALRNDPDYDGDVLYAVEERPFAVADAVPDRTLYRYSYRGVWAPAAGESIEPRLREVRVVEGRTVRLRTTLGVPAGTERVSFRLEADDGAVYYRGTSTGRTLDLSLVVDHGGARLVGDVAPEGEGTLPVDDATHLDVEAFAERADGGGVTYRLRLPVEAGESIRAMTPHVEACLEPLRCGGGATYVPGATPPDVVVETELTADDSS